MMGESKVIITYTFLFINNLYKILNIATNLNY
jgi:hypothetical protein